MNRFEKIRRWRIVIAIAYYLIVDSIMVIGIITKTWTLFTIGFAVIIIVQQISLLLNEKL